MTLDQAWEKFEKAAGFDVNAATDSLRRMARKGADKYLDEAVSLEETAIAGQ